MPSLKTVAVASAVAGFAAAAPAPVGQQEAHVVNQVANPNHIRNGPAAYAKALAKYGAPQSKVSSVMASTPGSVAANPEEYDSEYLSPVQIGSKTFKLDFDTGSSDLWVFGSGTAAGSHTTYSTSSGTQLKGQTWKISYGDGSSASGNVYSDTVSVGQTKVTKQAVEVATKASSSFTQGAPDGLLGLAFSSINTVQPTQQKTFFDNAVAQGLPAVFAADLQPSAPGKYDFGKLDSSYSSSDITYVPVDNSDGFWKFSPSSATINGKKVTAGPGIADTGTTLMLVDDSLVKAYYSQVSGAKNDQTQGGYVFSCDADLPDFTLNVGGHAATVPGDYINFAPVDNTGRQCFGGIQSDAGIGFAIYGDVFLKAQYVVFDQTTGSPRLGLANKAQN